MRQSNFGYEPVSVQRARLSKHAQRRCQQRGIDKTVVPIVTAFGERTHDGQGGIRYMMTDKSMRSLVRAIGRNQHIDGLAGVYVVLSADDGTVVTIAHRHA